MLKKYLILLIGTLSLSLKAMDDESLKRKRDELSEFSRNVKARVDTEQQPTVAPMEIDSNAPVASKSNGPIINMLIAVGSGQFKLENSLTPLMWAVQEHDTQKVLELLSNADINVNAQDSQGRTALFIAAQDGHTDIMTLLYLWAKNLDIDKPDNNGMTPLQIAVANKHEVGVELLLSMSNNNIDTRDYKSHFTALARAVISGHDNIIKLLLNAGANPTSIVTKEGKDIAVLSLYKGDDNEVVDLLKSKGQEYTIRGLEVIRALQDNKPDEARKLLAQGINVNAKTQVGYTPLHWAAINGPVDFSKLLIDSKAHVNAKHDLGFGPLDGAAYNGNKDIVKLLINNKADVNAKDQFGGAPLFEAVSSGNEEIKKEIVKMLIEHKAEVNDKDNNGYTPLHRYVIYAYHSVSCLKSQIEIINILIANKADINARNNQNNTPLQALWELQEARGWRRGNKDCIVTLVQLRANPNIQDTEGKTILHTWAKFPKYFTQEIKFLIKNNANVDLQDKEGNAPLHLAVKNGKTTIARLLINAGANVNIKNKDGETPLDRTNARNNKIISLLKSAGTRKG